MDFSKPGQTAVNLEDWTQSYKQRAIFLTHVIKVQQELIGIMRSRTTGLYTTGESESLFNGTYLAEIEDQAGGYIPFDLVIYLIKFSHLLVPQCLPDVDHRMFALACTSHFTNPYIWKSNNRETTFAGYENMALRVTEEMRQRNIRVADIHEAVDEETLEYLRGLKTLVFSTAPEDGDLRYHLQVLLDVSKSETSGVAKNLKTRSLDVNMAKLRGGTGRVFATRITFETIYQLTWVAESFTDYLIQYAGLIVKYQRPPYFDWEGFEDFATNSARNQNLPISVLLPQSLAVSEYDSNL
jgi:phosphoribosyl-ATP pyrophosphohydrolase